MAGAAALGVLLTTPTPRAPVRATTSLSVAQPDLEQLWGLLGPTLAANHKSFIGRLGFVEGFGAGEHYPQIWLRDSATLLPLSRWLYPRPALASWLEEHLVHQKPDGSLFDWIAAGDPGHFRQWAPRVREVHRSGPVGISADTNTCEADQEASAVRAAYAVYQVTGDTRWLHHKLAGETVLLRLERALRSVLARRLDSDLGLVENALTADWGDVSPTHADQRAIYVDPSTPRAVGLYTNALFVQASRELAELLDLGDRPRLASFWRHQAQAIAVAVNAQLWQEDRGFYRMHRTTTPALAAALPDDSPIFALGGNAQALLAEIPDAARAERIFDVAAARRREHDVSTIAGVLLPPFPKGTFRHPALATEWEYQNGGQWDWFAGRFLLAEYRRGRSRQATHQLVEVARRALRSGGLYEWYTRDGEGRGSPTYAGSAAALGQALFEGLFGVSLKANHLDLRVRLGALDAHLRLFQPASETLVEYDYNFDATAMRVRLAYACPRARAGTLAVRLPEGSRAAAVRLDGRVHPARTETVGRDTFVVLESDWNPHRLEIDLVRPDSSHAAH